MSYSLGKLTATGLAIPFLIACGGGAEPTPVAVALKAEVCTEGEARDTKLYIRNLDDFEWRDITFSLVKADETYAWESASLTPESQQAAEPFTDSLEFTTLGYIGYVGRLPAEQTFTRTVAIKRLHNFSSLESATIETNSPQAGEWAGSVHHCR